MRESSDPARPEINRFNRAPREDANWISARDFQRPSEIATGSTARYRERFAAARIFWNIERRRDYAEIFLIRTRVTARLADPPEVWDHSSADIYSRCSRVPLSVCSGYRALCICRRALLKAAAIINFTGGYLPPGAIYSDVKSRYPIFTKLRPHTIPKRARAIITVFARAGTTARITTRGG